jgi:hypothetical protein
MLRIVHSSQPSVNFLVEDLKDPVLAARTKAAVESVFGNLGMAGVWTVALAASDTRGRWDVAVRGSRGTHLFSFPAAASQVPRMMTDYLNRCVRRILSAPPRSAGALRVVSTR